MVSHRHHLWQTSNLSTLSHLLLPGVTSFLPPCSLFTPSNSRAPAAILGAQSSTHFQGHQGLTNNSSCCCRGSWGHTPPTPPSFESLHSVPQLMRMELSTCHLSQGCPHTAESMLYDNHWRVPPFPASQTPAPTPLFSHLQRGKNGPKGARLCPPTDHLAQGERILVPRGSQLISGV